MPSKQYFAKFDVTSQVFVRSALSCGIVNLKPIMRGHVLVVPQRVVGRFGELEVDEVRDLYTLVHRVVKVLSKERYTGAEGWTVSMQDGPVAGQSVPHVHVHVIPRASGDLEKNDDVYGMLDTASAEMESGWRTILENRPKFTAVDDEERKPRSLEELEKEAKWLAEAFASE
ncbi:Dinucleoside triphosphate hydrolase [Savitreella phatthalungensis]